MSRALKNTVLVKREDLQPIFSFKVRGAYCKIASLSDEERSRGVITASAGNHAQGVALSASRIGVEATIVMPQTTPEIKVQAVKRMGAKVIIHGERFDDSRLEALQRSEKENKVFVHPYDDLDVIAGQGTIAMEILRQFSDPIHAVFIPVGGGGLIAGMAAYIKYLRPEVLVIGVEASESACFKAAMDAGRRVVLTETGIFADGVAVSQMGKETFRIARKVVDDVITVSSDEICAAVKEIFDDTRSIAEPAGALGLAGLKKYVAQHQLKNKNLVTIESGANVNFDRLRYISERYEIGKEREMVLAVTIPEKAGSLLDFCRVLKDHNITEFNYRRREADRARIYSRIEVRLKKDRDRLLEKLTKKGYEPIDLSENEMAKMHIGHMVGGIPEHLEDERLYQVEFPECQGSLSRFLSVMQGNWSISLFHYRLDGGTTSNVLVGIQIPEEEVSMFEKGLTGLKYRFREESDNLAYNLFLK